MLSQRLIVRRQADDIQQCLVTRKKNSRGKGLSGFRFYSGVVTVRRVLIDIRVSVRGHALNGPFENASEFCILGGFIVNQ